MVIMTACLSLQGIGRVKSLRLSDVVYSFPQAESLNNACFRTLHTCSLQVPASAYALIVICMQATPSMAICYMQSTRLYCTYIWYTIWQHYRTSVSLLLIGVICFHEPTKQQQCSLYVAVSSSSSWCALASYLQQSSTSTPAKVTSTNYLKSCSKTILATCSS